MTKRYRTKDIEQEIERERVRERLSVTERASVCECDERVRERGETEQASKERRRR